MKVFRNNQTHLPVIVEIEASDIGIQGEASPDLCFEPLGIVLECDVGKRCYKVGDIWQVENQEQFEKRVNGQ